ncbi:MAG: hypothetical protein IJU37_07990 [Desulfovibrio sp.]|nr:hypothetical protein [Desulfovibrio sp.]
MPSYRRNMCLPILFCLLLAALLGGCALPLGPKPSPKPPQPSPAGPCVVLALPSTGQLAAIGGKITKGARLAQSEMALKGQKMRLQMIDSGAPDWLQKLDALPAECVVVGGPLQGRVFAQARTSHNLDKRAFFAFVPSLEQQDEGVRAWRFFPSPQDQVDALVNFISDGMHIQTYGAFYPADMYGTRMVGLLEQKLAARNLVLQKAAYNPGDRASWDSALASLFQAGGENGNTGLRTAFEALFLPDSWRNMQLLSPSLQRKGGNRLMLLGTALWEQGLSGKTVPQAHRYALAVFPGAWNPMQAPKALRAPGVDLWVALGYDFARFGASLNLYARPDSKEVSAAARRASRMLWGMAPISWDEAGIAHQKLYVFKVTASGMKPANPSDMQLSRTNAQPAPEAESQPLVDDASREASLPPEGQEAPASLPQPGQSTHESLPQPMPTQPVPAPQALPQGVMTPQHVPPTPVSAPIMRSSPRPSYKLSLPDPQ